MATPLWKASFVPASFRAVPFHIEVGIRNSGRRCVVHEYPKRDTPNAEDMGRSARRFSITGYVIGPNYFLFRDALIVALEWQAAGLLTLPTMSNIVGGVFMVQPLQYSMREERQRGGMAQFDMNFVESGQSLLDLLIDTASNVIGAADNLIGAGASSSQVALGAGTGQIGAGTPQGDVTIGDIEIGTPTP